MLDCNQRIVAPSLLAADFSQIEQEVKRCEHAQADWLHLDVMDGHFVDNISFGPAICAAASKSSPLFQDVHLMIHRPDHYLDRFIEEGAQNITIHLEADYDSDVAETLKRLKKAGVMAGLAISPSTPFESCQPYLEQVDLLLIMTVVPGFGGQSFMEKECMPKLAAARDYREKQQLNYHLQVDGGIDANSAPIATKNGANVLVAGSYCFGAKDMSEPIKLLRSA